MKTYIHNIELNDDSEFAKRFNYVSWLWGKYQETNDEQYLDEHFNSKLALEQGLPITYLKEYIPKR